MQIDWSKAPEWAMWHAFDEDGKGWWYIKKPTIISVCYSSGTGKAQKSGYDYCRVLREWDKTLIERNHQQKPDYTAQLLAIVEQQKAKGLAKYGVALEDANLSALELVEHALEEAVDFAQYLLALRDKLRKDAE